MASLVGPVIAPLYLFACLVLGGSAQGIWSNLFLQLSAIVILAWSILAGQPTDGRAARRLRWIAVAGLVVVLLTLVPLPPAIWTALPGREPIAEGLTLIGGNLPWMPLSLAPERTVTVLLTLLPAAAMLALVLRWPTVSPGRLALAVLVAMILSVVVGLMQVTRGDGWYLYKHSSVGAATGLFANSNHLASLLLASIPLIAALAAAAIRGTATRKSAGKDRFPILAGLALCAGLVVTGIILNGSFAILLLGGPMIAASALIFLPPGGVRLGRLALLILLMTVAGGGALALVGGDRLTRLAGQASVAERQEIWRSSADLAAEYFPAGSGLGTYPSVYHLQEDPNRVGREYVNHAHNDFLETVIELGAAGLLLLLAFLAWWVGRFMTLWRSSLSPPLVRAATLVTLGLMLHSLVDFPLRTAALSALFAAGIALMAMPRPSPPSDSRGQPRHLRLEDL